VHWKLAVGVDISSDRHRELSSAASGERRAYERDELIEALQAVNLQ
jgi:hypothetical protein